MKILKIGFFHIVLAFLVILFFISSPLFAQSHSYGVISGSLDGELKSKSAEYGQYELGNKSFNRGALGGGTRGYEWVINPSKYPGKRGVLGAIDAELDIGGSSKGNTFTTKTLGDTIRVGQTYTANYEIFKGFLSFDTSGIPYDAIITSATLSFYGKAKHIDIGGENFDIQVYKSVYTEPLWNPDWGAISGTVRGSLSTSNFIEGQRNTIAISALNANYLITKGGPTRIALVSSRTISAQQPSGNEYIEIYSANADDPNVRPKLDITYNGNAPDIRPALTWTGEQYFKMNGVYPEVIWVGENNLVFRIQYTHPLGIAPLTTQVWIDLNSDGDFYDPAEMVDMRESDQMDTDYTNGKNYYANVTLTSDGVSEIRYRFKFNDENSVEATGIATQVASLSNQRNINFSIPITAQEGNDILKNQGTISIFPTPNKDIIIDLSSKDISEVLVPDTLTIYKDQNEVTFDITIVDDFSVDGNQTVSIVVSSSGYILSTKAIQVIDNDIASIIIDPNSGLTTSEDGTTATFTIVLNSKPTADVSIDISSSDIGECLVSPSILTFEPANWNMPQTITITGIDDDIEDGNVLCKVITSSAVSNDINYNGFNPEDVSLINLDNEGNDNNNDNTDGGLCFIETID